MARNNLGIVLEKMGRREEARREWLKVIEMSRGNRKARFCLAAGFVKSKDYEKAREYFESIGDFGPTGLDARLSFAWLLATCPDANIRNGRKAVKLLKQVGEPRHPLVRVRLLDCLAAAYAEAGDFEKAEECAGDALHFAAGAGVKGVAGIRERLGLYGKREAYKDEGEERVLKEKGPANEQSLFPTSYK